jgi:flagellar hook protein FlgE
MSLYGMMRTGASGMNAQANRLGTVADNMANANTTGYKRASAEFSSLILPGSAGSYNSGAVTTDVRYSISQAGALEFTSSKTDMALDGSGFFIVTDDNGLPFLTRAGSFVPDGEGYLVNAAGFQLMGYNYESGTPTPVVNGFDGLVPVNVSAGSLTASPSTTGYFQANLDEGATIVPAADLPSTNSATADFTSKSSLIAIDNLGGEVLLDFYYTKTATNNWEVTVYDRAGATAGTSFPYASAPLATTTLQFDPLNGQLAGASATDISLTVPGGAALTIDLSNMSQLNYAFTVDDANVERQQAKHRDRYRDFGRRDNLCIIRKRIPRATLPGGAGRCNQPGQAAATCRQRLFARSGFRRHHHWFRRFGIIRQGRVWRA